MWQILLRCSMFNMCGALGRPVMHASLVTNSRGSYLAVVMVGRAQLLPQLIHSILGANGGGQQLPPVYMHTCSVSGCCPHGMLAATNSSEVGAPFYTLQCWWTHSRFASMLRNTLLAVCTKCSAMSCSMPGCSNRIRSTSSTLSSQRLQDVHALYETDSTKGLKMSTGSHHGELRLSCCNRHA
jgi:hypothetical protein